MPGCGLHVQVELVLNAEGARSDGEKCYTEEFHVCCCSVLFIYYKFNQTKNWGKGFDCSVNPKSVIFILRRLRLGLLKNFVKLIQIFEGLHTLSLPML